MSMNETQETKNWLKVEAALLIFLGIAFLVTVAVLLFMGWPSDLPEKFSQQLTIEKLIELKNQLITARLQALTTIVTIWAVIAILLNVYYTAKRTEALDMNALAEIKKVEVARVHARAKDQELELAKENARLIEQENITKHFLTAIEQLGSDKIPVRIGGIYALERIANNFPTDNSTIVEVISAFIRENALKTTLENQNLEETEAPQKAEDTEPSRKLPVDIQTALTVLGRRDPKKDEKNYRLDLSNTNISGASLSSAKFAGAFLKGANLQRADLLQANLQGALLSSANLQGAFLMGAKLQGTVFRGANLQGAFLVGADLLGADLSGANLQGSFLMGANLLGANLQEANLLGADLSEAENLEPAQIESAKVDSTTALPHNFSQ